MYWVHLNSNDFVFKKEKASKKPSSIGGYVVEVAKEEYEQIIVGYRLVDNKWVETTEIAEELESPVKLRIAELKAKLRDTDWVVVEILEAQLGNKDPEHNFDEIYNKRQAWRDEITQLVLESD